MPKCIKKILLEFLLYCIKGIKFQKMNPYIENLPRDADKIRSEYFGFVAIWVTHPLWPRKVPLSCSVSVIFQ